jgi:Uma2 family endonuclease
VEPVVANSPQRARDFDLREIIDGIEYVTPSPFGIHQRILQKLLLSFHRYLEKNPAGEIFISPLDVIFQEDTILQPDLIYIANENSHILSDWVRGVPDLVAEVVSKHSTTRDTVEKKALYEKFGVKEYWVVFPENACIEVFTLVDGKFEIHSASDIGDEKVVSKLLPGLEIDAKAFFESSN